MGTLQLTHAFFLLWVRFIRFDEPDRRVDEIVIDANMDKVLVPTRLDLDATTLPMMMKARVDDREALDRCKKHH